MTGERVPHARSSTALLLKVRGCLGVQAARDTAPPAHAPEAGSDPRVPWEEVGGPNQGCWQAGRLWPGGRGKHGDSASLGEPPSLTACGHLYRSCIPWDLPGGPGALHPPEPCICKLGFVEGVFQ